ncbi:hypothetical protein [Nocardiopsis oceani]
MVDSGVRFRHMDGFGSYRRISDTAAPLVEDIQDQPTSREVSRTGNVARNARYDRPAADGGHQQVVGGLYER